MQLASGWTGIAARTLYFNMDEVPCLSPKRAAGESANRSHYEVAFVERG